MTNFIGHSLGRYHILEQLGEGGMATVYKAYDTRLERDVAVKVIRMDLVGPAMLGQMLKRFEREAKALASLTHPFIVPVIDYGEHEGTPYLVMPYLSGGTLKQKLGVPMFWEEAVRILLPIAEALEYAHEQNIIHRDLKPSNILLTSKGQPMLSDFGIAKILDLEEGHTLTAPGVGIGTPEYMSPEQGMGKPVGPATDIYSLGIVLYELITGRVPFTADTPMAVVFKHVNDPLLSPKKVVPILPEAVEKIILKALAKKPEDRYVNMDAFAGALERVLASSPISGRGVGKEEIPKKEEHALPKLHSDDSMATLLQEEDTRTITQTGTQYELPHSVPVPANQPPHRKKFPWFPWAAGGVLVLACIVIAFLVVPELFGTSTPEPTKMPVMPPVAPPTSAPPTAAHPTVLPPTATFIPTYTPTVDPTLAPGATQVSGKDGMVLLYVPAGEFLMGSTDSNTLASSDEKPQHTVYLDAFWIDQTEVTNTMFALFVNNNSFQTDAERNGSSWAFIGANWNKVPGADWQHPLGPSSSLAGKENHPVVDVSWNDAVAYCEWAGSRLPSEAEWEKAARGTDGRMYPWGNSSPNCSLANYWDCGGTTEAVGNHPSGASPYGVLDMAGNVWEWVNDRYSETYYMQSPGSNPTGPSSGDSKVLGGGSWFNSGGDIRSTIRGRGEPGYTGDYIGFRCARSAP